MTAAASQCPEDYMGAFWFKEEGKKTSTPAMNTSSLQKMKMAARMSCLPSQTPQR